MFYWSVGKKDIKRDAFNSSHNLYKKQGLYDSMMQQETIKAELELPREFPALVKIDEKEVPEFVKKALALELFREKRISLGKAATIAGLSKEEMMGLLALYKIPIHYTVEELREDVAS